jgi:hypothetical protein
MKCIFICLIILMFSANTLFSQEDSGIATVNTKAEALALKTTGKLKIKMPSVSSKEDVVKSASYYVHNFLVDFDNESKIAEVIMVTNDSRNRQIIVRFLSACAIQQINIEGELIELSPFYESYLK